MAHTHTNTLTHTLIGYLWRTDTDTCARITYLENCPEVRAFETYETFF